MSDTHWANRALRGGVWSGNPYARLPNARLPVGSEGYPMQTVVPVTAAAKQRALDARLPRDQQQKYAPDVLSDLAERLAVQAQYDAFRAETAGGTYQGRPIGGVHMGRVDSQLVCSFPYTDGKQPGGATVVFDSRTDPAGGVITIPKPPEPPAGQS